MSTTQAAESIAAAIDQLPNSSVYSRRVRARLTRLARRGPGAFWPAYLAVMDANQYDDPVRQFAQEAVRSGVTSETSLAELVEEHLAVAK